MSIINDYNRTYQHFTASDRAHQQVVRAVAAVRFALVKRHRTFAGRQTLNNEHVFEFARFDYLSQVMAVRSCTLVYTFFAGGGGGGAGADDDAASSCAAAAAATADRGLSSSSSSSPSSSSPSSSSSSTGFVAFVAFAFALPRLLDGEALIDKGGDVAASVDDVRSLND